ncbi:MAG: serine/threonine protein kinase, partial [Rhodospirillales bacterium]|nr:serine/threonine protein kinase [Rhodospirillales bacterium]
GSTYLGWDDKLHVKVAVKEYYPNFLVSRTADGRSVRPHSEDSADQFYFGMEKFLDEARLLAQFRDVREIINVVDFFEENDTAYIVMEYVAGRPLNTVLKERGGRLPLTEVIGLVLPIIIALEKLHERNIIHRDISPDNIYLADDGRVKLLDFGAARQALGDKTQSMTVVLKRGYAPAEQYSSTSRQGPWTDVYALCATIYRAITGQPPPEAVSRWEEDPLVPPSRMGVAIPASVEAALLKGMTLRWQERLQNMAELRDAMRGR